MTSTLQLPAWLQQKNSNNDTTSADGPTKDTEMGNMMSVELDSNTPAPNSAAATYLAGAPTRLGQCKKWTCIIVSTILFVLFVASSTFQQNDTGGSAITYLLFYALHAIVAGAYLLSYCLCTPRLFKVVQTLGVSMMIWSIVFIILSSVQYTNTDSGGTNAGGDNPNATKKEEIAYEIAGATLGLASAMYHVFIVYRAGQTN
jgi:hypothetical protein